MIDNFERDKPPVPSTEVPNDHGADPSTHAPEVESTNAHPPAQLTSEHAANIGALMARRGVSR
jgi:hypothetical protein